MREGITDHEIMPRRFHLLLLCPNHGLGHRWEQRQYGEAEATADQERDSIEKALLEVASTILQLSTVKNVPDIVVNSIEKGSTRGHSSEIEGRSGAGKSVTDPVIKACLSGQ